MCVHVHTCVCVGGYRKKTGRKYTQINMSQQCFLFVLILHLSIFSKFSIKTLIAFTIRK